MNLTYVQLMMEIFEIYYLKTYLFKEIKHYVIQILILNQMIILVDNLEYTNSFIFIMTFIQPSSLIFFTIHQFYLKSNCSNN